MGQLVTREQGQATIQAYLRGDGFQKEVAKLVHSTDVAKRFARVALTQVMEDDKLLQCSVESLIRCFYTLAELRMEPGRDAYLIPYGRQAGFIIKWEGYVRAARDSGEIKHVWTEVIKADDDYAIVAGSVGPSIEHTWKLPRTGEVVGAYACARWMDGEVTTMIEDRAYLDKCKAKGGPVWDQWHEQMCKKTMAKRLCKGLPLGEAAVDRLAEINRVDEKEPVVIVQVPGEDGVGLPPEGPEGEPPGQPDLVPCDACGKKVTRDELSKDGWCSGCVESFDTDQAAQDTD